MVSSAWGTGAILWKEVDMTRANYMEEYSLAWAQGGAKAATEVHRTYYAQYVNGPIISIVVSHIGAAKLLASKDPDFNDIPVGCWDKLEPFMKHHSLALTKKLKDYWSLTQSVCIAKEAARTYIQDKATATQNPRFDLESVN